VSIRLKLHIVLAGLLVPAAIAAPQDPPVAKAAQQQPDKFETEVRAVYLLGPEDSITIQVPDAEEIGDKPYRIGDNGCINVPLAGQVRAAGLTLEQLEAELVSRLKAYFKKPVVSLSVAEFRSQPVSVIGAVNTPGVIQLQGKKTLIEILSMAGGLRADAGHSVKITRKRQWGMIPLPGATMDPTGRFSIGEVSLKATMEARNPEQNILIRPEDIISIPRADIVYVIGDVSKSGGFVLTDQETLSVLQALALAGGLERTAAPSKAKILRPAPGAARRTEILVDLKKILAGEANDVAMVPDDILFVPGSAGKKATIRTLEALVTMGTSIGVGAAIYRR
jgi:polysaccharide export outer membrane protein